MRTLLIVFFQISVISLVQGQLSGYYHSTTSNENVDCYLSLYINGNYSVELIVQETDDMAFCSAFSQGVYSIKDNTIILNDANHGFVMQLQKSHPTRIITNRGFVFLKDMTFIYDRGSDSADMNFWRMTTNDINYISQKKEREVYQQLHKDLYPPHLYLGTYESENNCQPNQRGEWEKGRGYELNIQENYQYTLYYNRILILQGTWKRVGNELALYDESLQHSFYLLIGQDGLISKYLPGEYRSCILKYNPKCCGKTSN